MRAELRQLEAALGHTYANQEYLVRALTHKSRLSQKAVAGEPANSDNEQLEFLGDSILGFLVSEWLVSQLPNVPEGQLSKRKAQFVSASFLHQFAQRLDLGRYLLLGRGEELSGGREKKALLADAVEAILASLYLDGGLGVARRFVLEKILAGADLTSALSPVQSDYKTALQERAQALRLPAPRYQVVGENGPEHAKMFTVEVRVGPQFLARAEGSSKKSAEQRAAEALFAQLPAPGA